MPLPLAGTKYNVPLVNALAFYLGIRAVEVRTAGWRSIHGLACLGSMQWSRMLFTAGKLGSVARQVYAPPSPYLAVCPHPLSSSSSPRVQASPPKPGTSPAMNTPHMEVFQHLLRDMDTGG